ncbi:MAG: PKD domain-containing protein [Saprospiraceae bacterium]
MTLTVTNAGSNSATQTDYIIVNTVPTARFRSSVNGNTASFTNSSSNATSYSWDFGDNMSSTESGRFTLMSTMVLPLLSNTNDCGSVTTSPGRFHRECSNGRFCQRHYWLCALTVQFSNQSSANAVSFEWDFPGGDPSSSTDENPTVTYSSVGSFSVTLTVTNSAGSNSVTETSYVVVNTVPATGFTAATNVFTATFTNTTANGTTYSWDFGDGTSSTESDPVHEYSGDGTYTVTLTATNACGDSTITQDVVITSFPQAGFTANATTGCAPFTVQFMDQSSSTTHGMGMGFPGGTPSSSTDQNWLSPIIM